MPLINIAPITISLDPSPTTRPGFGVAALFADLTPAQDALFGPDLGIEVTPAGWKDELAAVGITAGEPAYIAVEDFYSQDAPGKPEKLILFRRADPQAQLRTYQVVGNTDGTFSVTLDGQVASFLAAANTVTQIRDGLLAAIALLPNAADFVVVSVLTDSFTVQAAFAGLPFTSAVSAPVSGELTETLTTANIGMPEDIAAAKGERTDWYAVFETSHAEGNILATAAAIESEKLLYIAQNNDSDATDGAATDDIGSKLRALSYTRTGIWYSSNNTQYVDGAMLGKMLPSDPGSETWAFQEVASVTGEVITSANDTTLKNKNYSWVEEYTAGGKTYSRNGFVSSGQFLDVIRGRDWLEANLQIDILDALLANPKIAYNDEGIEILRAVVENRLRLAAEQGIIDEDTIVITVIPKADMPANKIGERLYDGITFEAVLTGAIHTVPVSGGLKTAA